MSDTVFLIFTNSLTALLLCITVGFFCRQKNIITDAHVSGFNELLIKVTMPCTAFIALMRPFTPELLRESLFALGFTAVIYLLGGLIMMLVAKVMRATAGEREGWMFGSAFPNVAFMGIPVVMAVYGADGLIYVSMAMVSFNILSFTVGVRIFKNAPREFDIISLAKNSPVLPAAIIGFVMFLFELRLPSPVEGAIGLISGVTTPVSMLVIGAILARRGLKAAFSNVRVFIPTVVKLAVMPLITFGVLSLFDFNPVMVQVLITLMAMPAAAATAILAEQYGQDPGEAAKFVVVSTVLSVVGVPLISLLF